ncbi:FliI/YscN family ATPase [Castellaniella sp.]|uniref:FliI/YscN family ATPase n=1 Tax=Castellaniella sp. TaxID=1955812 RepID=UPI00356A7D86
MTPIHGDLTGALRERLLSLAQEIRGVDGIRRVGRITRATGLVIEATGLGLPVGAACRIALEGPPDTWGSAEVVGFRDDILYLMPQNDMTGLRPGAAVLAEVPGASGVPPWPGATDSDAHEAVSQARRVPAGSALLGRILDGAGTPLDGQGLPAGLEYVSLHVQPINPLERAPIRSVLDVGVRAINGLLTVGRGQRMGLFAGSGVGKSVLLSMMARYTLADVIVVGLIGERGREVKEFIEQNLGPDGLARSVVVAAPADASPLLRLQGAAYATRLAEYFRAQGQHVLLLMDSLTRYAMAQREIALAIGEPPATKGYPPSVFAKLPALVERAGNGSQRDGNIHGSITAFYTVLTEGDDQQDPIADAARAILDGHIVLARALADAGHYPAIDIGASISRVMPAIVPKAQLQKSQAFKQLNTLYQRNQDLITVGAYVAGQDAQADLAIARHPGLQAYLQQDFDTRVDYSQAQAELDSALGLAPSSPQDRHGENPIEHPAQA